MLYRFGAPVVALYVRLALFVPEQTVGLAPKVIVGSSYTLTL
ncbi:hypothetical protein ES705_49151 [subsurface metagenome]